MRALLLFATSIFLTSCATDVYLRGRYARSLSSTDIEQIRRFADARAWFSHVVITLDAIRPDQVRLLERTYKGGEYEGSTIQIIRRGNGWVIDKNFLVKVEVGGRIITVY